MTPVSHYRHIVVGPTAAEFGGDLQVLTRHETITPGGQNSSTMASSVINDE